jgi:hypothetical protein
VLHDVLSVPGQRRIVAPADEVAVLEQLEVRFALHQRADRAVPEGPTDHRGGLEGELLIGWEEVYACREHCVH